MGLRLCQTGPQGALFISQCPQRCHLSVSIPRRCRGVAASTATVGGREMNAPIQVAVAASGARQAKTTEPPCYCRGLVGTSSFLPLRCSRDHGEAMTGQGRMGSPTTAPSPHSWRFSLIRGPQPQHNYCRREEAGRRRELGRGEEAHQNSRTPPAASLSLRSGVLVLCDHDCDGNPLLPQDAVMERRWSCLARATTKRIVIEMARRNLISVPLCLLSRESIGPCLL